MKSFFFFGDSITLGVNDPQGGGWVGRFAAKASGTSGMPVPPTTFYNLGVRKQSSRHILARWESEYLVRRISDSQDYLIFCFGTVDMAAPDGNPVVPLHDSINTARLLLQQARDRKPVLMVCPPPVADSEHRKRIGQLASSYAELCHTMAIPCLNLFAELHSSNVFMNDLSDGVHPGAQGNSLIADLLMQFLPVQDWMYR